MKDYARYFAENIKFAIAAQMIAITLQKEETNAPQTMNSEAAALSNHCFILEESNRHTMEATSQF